MSADIPPRGRMPIDLPEGDRPDDLFGSECETMPMPTGAQAPVVPVTPVGPGNPPAASRWKKGGASPNPKGRPPKRNLGTLTERMAAKISVVAEGRSTQMTRREYLDRRVMDMAAKGSVMAIRLWAERVAHDADIQAQIVQEEAEKRQMERWRAANPRSAATMDHGERFAMKSNFWAALNQELEGGVYAIIELTTMGAIHLDQEELIIDPWIERWRRGLPPT